MDTQVIKHYTSFVVFFLRLTRSPTTSVGAVNTFTAEVGDGDECWALGQYGG